MSARMNRFYEGKLPIKSALVTLVVTLGLSGVSHAQKAPLRVAVMDFSAAATAAEFEPLGAGLQAMVTTDLSELPMFTLIERARLKDLQAELRLADSGAVDKATAAKLGALAGASHLLAGTFTVVGGKMRIDARLFSVQSGDVVLTEKAEGNQTAFFELEKQLVQKIVTTVGVKLTKAQKGELQKPETQSFEAFSKFSQGVVLYDQKKVPEAVAAMQAAVAADAGFTLAATRLAEFSRSLPLPKPPTPEAQCKPNPLTTPQCGAGGGSGTVPPSPTVLGSTDNRTYSMIVRANETEARCSTPCQLYLPPGKAEVEVLSPVQFKKTVTVDPGATSLRVSGRNRNNLIIGSVLAGTTGLMLVASIVLYAYERPYDTATGNPSQDYKIYAPIPLAVATGMIYPSVHFLLRMGTNDVSVGK